jgi:hypothetical protein
MNGVPAMMKPEQRKANARLGLILASVAAVFFVGFLAKHRAAGRLN